MKHTFVIQGVGFGGSGNTVKEAAKQALNCVSTLVGADKPNQEYVSIDIIVGDDCFRLRVLDQIQLRQLL